MSKDKYDLSNVGGQPKDWIQNSQEAEVEAISLRCRYFANVRFPTEEAEVYLGTFSCQEHAERRAGLKYTDVGWPVISVRPETKVEAALYRVSRVAIRFTRIAVGAVMGTATYILLADGAQSISDVPLAALTLNIIFTAIFKLAAFCGLMWASWAVAFGEGPTDP